MLLYLIIGPPQFLEIPEYCQYQINSIPDKRGFLVFINYHDQFDFEEEYITFDILVEFMSFFQ